MDQNDNPAPQDTQPEQIDQKAEVDDSTQDVGNKPSENENQAQSIQPTENETKVTKRHFNFKKLLLGLGIFLLISLLGVGGYYYFFVLGNTFSQNQEVAVVQPTNNPVFKLVARAEYVTGDVWRLVDGRKTEIIEGDELAEKDEVKTEKDGRAILSFDDGSVVRIAEDTQIKLASLTASLMQIDQDSGTVFARVQKDANHKFIVDASGVFVESQGTAFSVENQEKVVVSVYENSVKVTQEGKELQVVQSQQWREGEDGSEKIDDKKLANNEFLSWSLKEELNVEAKTQQKEQLAKPTSAPATGSINLTGEALNEGIRLYWSASGMDASQGFKVIKNLSGNPVYPGDSAIYANPEALSYLWQIYDGSTYHFRICQYLGDGTCGTYSNDITVTAKKINSSDSSGSVTGITTSGTMDGSSAKITWDVNGYSPKGFKIIYSLNSGPTYPTRDGDTFIYLASPDARSNTISGLSAGKTYFIRVCEYLGGKCGVYSNEITLSY